MKNYPIIALTLLSGVSFAQEDTTKPNPFKLRGYIETYFTNDFAKPTSNTRPDFIYNYNRNKEFNINLGYLKAAYSNEKLRANLALGTGTYMNANYASEPGVLKNIYEANIGIKLSSSQNIWVDAGILPSHIGFESAIGKDNWTLTRSMLAENSPYFESGVRISYTNKNEKWYVAAMYLNGWQRIQRPDGNTTPAFGIQTTYKPTGSLTLNYSNFIGNDRPDSLRQWRIFHNFYAIYDMTDKWAVTAGFDIGNEQKEKGSSKYNTWYSPVVIVKTRFTDRWSASGRAEYYSDKNQVIIKANSADGFQCFGWSANVDYKITNAILWRIEFRNLQSKDAIFSQSENPKKVNSAITTSLSASF